MVAYILFACMITSSCTVFRRATYKVGKLSELSLEELYAL